MKQAFIFHGTGGYPEENWFPWMKTELEKLGYDVTVPQFPTPDNQTPETWSAVFEKFRESVNEETVILGHSLGGAFLLHLLPTLKKPIALAAFIAAPVGIQPILNYTTDKPFLDKPFDWQAIRKNAKNFIVYQSDTDPFVPLGNGEELAKQLGVKLSFVANAGHFNEKAGYLRFEKLLERVKQLTVNS